MSDLVVGGFKRVCEGLVRLESVLFCLVWFGIGITMFCKLWQGYVRNNIVWRRLEVGFCKGLVRFGMVL